MKKERIIAAVLSIVTVAGALGGCASKKETSATNNQIVIRVGGWPSDKNSKQYALQEERKAEFEKENPNIKIQPDEWGFDLDSFLPKAASGQLPDIYITSFTEIKRIVDSGYASDISKQMNEYKYMDYLRDDVVNLISDETGGVYAVPVTTYSMGLLINMKVFNEAGLLNEDGTPIIPKTWDDVAQLASQIKQKTGKPGFGMATMNNVGGWHFLNIAWAFGTNKEFAKLEDGHWKADFATPECTAALQYVKDLRWKYNAVSDNALFDFEEMYKMFGSGQIGMMIASPPLNALISAYGMNKDDLAVVSMPEGPAGKFTQIGGEIYVLKNGLSDEQIDACFKWMEFNGITPEINEEKKTAIDDAYRIQNEDGLVVGIKPYSMWKTDNVPPVRKYEEEIIDKYTNVNTDLFEDYVTADNVQLVSEPPVSCQQLYTLLDGCIQSVFADKNADPAEVLKEAANNYQINYLDKMN